MDGITLADAMKLFLSQYKPTSRKSYQNDLKHLINFLGQSKEIQSITPFHIVEYSESLEKKTYATATWNKRVKATRTFFNWAVKFGILTQSPARVFKTRTHKGTVSRQKAMPEDDFATLLNYVTLIRDRRLIALVLFCGDTGCRRGGVSGLKWEHVNFQIREAVVTEKGNASRPVGFGELCANALIDWHKEKKSSVYVFSLTDKPMSAASISQLLRRTCIRAGIQGRGVHALRHRKGYQFADNNLQPNAAKTALGHSDVTTTLRHYYPDDWMRAKQAIENLASKPIDKPDSKVIKPTFKQA